jgi:hypothetical protein
MARKKGRVPPTREPSLEVFGEQVRRNVVAIGERFTDPDDDWLPGLLHLENERHEHEVYGLDPELFQPGRKDAVFHQLAELLRERQALRYALLINGWMLVSKMREGESTEEAADRFMAQTGEWVDHFGEHPDRVEMLTVELVDRERGETWQAAIKRYPDRRRRSHHGSRWRAKSAGAWPGCGRRCSEGRSERPWVGGSCSGSRRSW